MGVNIEIVSSNKLDLKALLRSRIDKQDEGVLEVVSEIIEKVKKEGDKALREFTLKFQGSCPDEFEIDRGEMKLAFENVNDDFREAIVKAAHNIKVYHEHQKQSGYEIKGEQGTVLGQVIRGMDKVGLYVPGGTAAYPSTVLMNAIPAKIAEVGEIIMVTPRAEETILAAAYVAGVDRVFVMGGAQAVAALAYGTDSVPQVDKIVGPGNIYVATAKKLLFGQVDIEMVAGPSEILVLADETANPRYVAADMLSQAEHDELAAAILLTVDEELAKSVKEELEKQLEALERKEIAEKSLANFGEIIVCKTPQEMVDIANEIAPEHLEVLMENPLAYVAEIRNAGSIFLGEYAPEPLGDYFSGTNHVLPTSGTARFASPLGVYDFIKRTSYTYYTKEALEEAKDDIMKIGETEGLTAHAKAVGVRFED